MPLCLYYFICARYSIMNCEFLQVFNSKSWCMVYLHNTNYFLVLFIFFLFLKCVFAVTVTVPSLGPADPVLIVTPIIGGSKEGGARDSSSRSKFFHFHAVFGKKRLAHPLWELAPPSHQENPGSSTAYDTDDLHLG